MHRYNSTLKVIKKGGEKTILFLHIKGAQYLAFSTENRSYVSYCCRQRLNTPIAASVALDA